MPVLSPSNIRRDDRKVRHDVAQQTTGCGIMGFATKSQKDKRHKKEFFSFFVSFVLL
jgi:hypothetical protein